MIEQAHVELDFGRIFVAFDPEGHRLRVLAAPSELQMSKLRGTIGFFDENGSTAVSGSSLPRAAARDRTKTGGAIERISEMHLDSVRGLSKIQPECLES